MALLLASSAVRTRVPFGPAPRRRSSNLLPLPLCLTRRRIPNPNPSILSSKVKFTSPNDSLRATSPPECSYPSPIPDFAEAETEKFKGELLLKLAQDEDTFGDDLDVVVEVCAQMFREFLYEEYGGPGTLLVEPFTDMFVELKERRLPGASPAARAALLWAQNHVDQDWRVWNSTPLK